MKGRYFEWDDAKNLLNIKKHGVDFSEAMTAFSDKNRIIAKDTKHSEQEARYFLFGKTQRGVLTVRFTFREKHVRIIGAGYWRQGRKKYLSERSENE